MATLASSSPHLLLHRLILRRSTPFFSSALASKAKQCFPSITTTPSLTLSHFSTRSLFSSLAPPCSVSEKLANDVVLLEDVKIETEIDDNAADSAVADSAVAVAEPAVLKNSSPLIPQPPPPSLSVKEKKDLASYAHSLGKKLKSQQVGKSGVTDTVIMALIETLEANELLKLKIRNTCPGEWKDVVKQLEETTGSLAVGQIGRTVILYRPSLTKLKAEEKKREAQRVYLKRQTMSKPFPQGRRPASAQGQGEDSRQYGRGRRGSSRY